MGRRNNRRGVGRRGRKEKQSNWSLWNSIFFIVLVYIRPSSILAGNNAIFGERLLIAAHWGCRIWAPSTIWPFLSVLEHILLWGYTAPLPLFIMAAKLGKTQNNPSICTLERWEVINSGFTGSFCLLLLSDIFFIIIIFLAFVFTYCIFVILLVWLLAL